MKVVMRNCISGTLLRFLLTFMCIIVKTESLSCCHIEITVSGFPKTGQWYFIGVKLYLFSVVKKL